MYPFGGKCAHDGLIDAVEITPVEGGPCFSLAGGSGASTEADKHTRLLIDLAGLAGPSINPKFIIGGPPALLAALPNPEPIPILRLEWPDMGVPLIRPTWWRGLVEAIAKIYPAGRITIACAGGHGRTGTAMAAMLLASDPQLTVATAVAWVRTHHCKHAIEGNTTGSRQLEYLYDFRPDENPTVELDREMNPPKTTYTTSHTTHHIADSTYCAKSQSCMRPFGHVGECSTKYVRPDPAPLPPASSAYSEEDEELAELYAQAATTADVPEPCRKTSCTLEAGHKGNHKKRVRVQNGHAPLPSGSIVAATAGKKCSQAAGCELYEGHTSGHVISRHPIHRVL